ncbi:flagellar filament capping protein FliD [Massilia sp. LjRoot122]|uniref:flagellar filament capping protein FliD n=1 Tax=Massilia sp. LjRoot122 TaxID=3342257 RepID=UPI003ECD85FC
MATSGIGSGLDVNGIVSQLMAIEARPLTVLARKEASYQAKLSAYGSVSGALSSFQSALKSLSSPDRFQTVTATPGDATIFTGTATVKAVAGNYSVNVTQLAKAQTVSSAGMASPTTTIGDGAKTTLTFEFGTISGGKLVDGKYTTDPSATSPTPAFTQDAKRSVGTVVIDASNNSLQGIRDAINKAGIGVTASIISDGSDTPNRLVLTSDKTGASSSMKISVARADGAPPDSSISDLLAYDPAGTQQLKQTSAALDTKLSVNGVDVSSPTNTVEGAIQGVNLTVSKVGESSLKVERDTGAVRGAINTFVKAFNDLDKTIKGVSSYDAATKQAGLLLGDSSVRGIRSQIRGMLSEEVEGSKLKNLMQLGMGFKKDGTLEVDSAKLDKIIANNFDDIAGLFASMGSTTDSLVSYTSSTSATRPGEWALNVDALATQGSLKAAAAPADLNIVQGVNDQLAMTIDGVSATITLPARTYTPASLALALQSAVNSASEFASKDVAISVEADADGKLGITSKRYGSASTVTVGGNGAENLFGTSPEIRGGADIAATINGIKAEGSGQSLTGARGTPAEGLKLLIAGGATGARGTVGFSQGFAHQLSAIVDNFVGSKGLVASQTDSINSNIKALGKQKEALNVRLEAMEKRYRAQYVALDAMLTNMSNTSNYLTQQLQQISNLSSQSS